MGSSYGLQIFLVPHGAFKILLLVFSILCIIISSSARQDCRNVTYKYTDISSGAFYMTVAVLSLIINFALIIAYYLFYDNLQTFKFNWWTIEILYSGLWAFMCLLSSALMASGVKHTADNNQAVCDMPFKALKIAAGVGFLTMFLYIASIPFLLKEMRTPRELPKQDEQDAPLSTA